MNKATYPLKSQSPAAGEDTHVVASPCELGSVVVYNATGSDAYLLVFDAAAVIADGPFAAGTRLPLPPVLVPGTGSPTQSYDFAGVGMTRGVSCVLSTTATQVTAAAGANRFLVTFR